MAAGQLDLERVVGDQHLSVRALGLDHRRLARVAGDAPRAVEPHLGPAGERHHGVDLVLEGAVEAARGGAHLHRRPEEPQQHEQQIEGGVYQRAARRLGRRRPLLALGAEDARKVGGGADLPYLTERAGGQDRSGTSENRMARERVTRGERGVSLGGEPDHCGGLGERRSDRRVDAHGHSRLQRGARDRAALLPAGADKQRVRLGSRHQLRDAAEARGVVTQAAHVPSRGGTGIDDADQLAARDARDRGRMCDPGTAEARNRHPYRPPRRGRPGGVDDLVLRGKPRDRHDAPDGHGRWWVTGGRRPVLRATAP